LSRNAQGHRAISLLRYNAKILGQVGTITMALLSSLKPTVYLSASWAPPGPAIKNVQNSTLAIPQIQHPTSVAERWASYILAVCKSEKDPRTLAIWAREVAVSYTTLCESCRLVDVQPRNARDFARILRIVIMPSFNPRQLVTFLDVSDRRTLDSILEKAGFGQQIPPPQHLSVSSFLDFQQFIAPQNTGLKIIREVFTAAAVA
jgi:hypothetical protein